MRLADGQPWPPDDTDILAVEDGDPHAANHRRLTGHGGQVAGRKHQPGAVEEAPRHLRLSGRLTPSVDLGLHNDTAGTR
jgi:hypothetical protein